MYSGDVLLYTLDDLTGSLLHSHSMALSSQQYPDAAVRSGPVHCMSWTPDGSAMMASWCRGGFSLWSTFGALFFCSLHGDYGISIDSIDFSQSLVIKSMAWGAEGYHLLLVSETSFEDQQGNASRGDIVVLQFAKTALMNNPTTTNHEHVLLQAEDRLYLHTADSLAYKQGDSLSVADSRQWQIVQIPLGYLTANWPIKYAAIDVNGRYVAVSSKRGMAHCNVSTKKWKLFGNESQEKAMTCRGGIVWWKDIIIIGCHNYEDSSEEVRMYSRSSRLDDNFMSHLIKLSSPVAIVNVFRDFLLVLTSDRRLFMYGMDRQPGLQVSGSAPVVILAKLQEISIGQYIPHISSLISLELSALRTEAAGSSPSTKGLPESIIANVAGKLLLLQRDHSSAEKKGKRAQFLAPVVLASGVEHVWASAYSKPSHRYLLEALWLGCGAGGMKVWLPLFPRDGQHGSNFLSKRIMLTFTLDIYPLLVHLEEAIALGVTCDTTVAHASQLLPFCSLERTIFLYHILKQLLRRNLGGHALQIARSCESLPYFAHVLELMLHNVLEEEAPNAGLHPMPDALLPQVVAFIQEFPQYLETIGHCTRKTEVAMWYYLFQVVGNPKDLFQKCIESERLEIAASYLIIIQNLEPPFVSKQYATRLLDSSLEHSMFELSRDLVRFLKAIGSGEVPDSPNRSMLTTPMSAPPVLVPVADRFEVALQKEKERLGSQTNVVTLPADFIDDTGKVVRRPHFLADLDLPKEEWFIDIILCRHARKLLSSCQLRQLGKFAAILDFPLVSWLNKERNRAALIDDFSHAILSLHQQMEWPMPVRQVARLDGDSLSVVSSGSTHSDYHRLAVSGDLSPRHSSHGDITPTTRSLSVASAHDDDVLSVPEESRAVSPQDGEESEWEGELIEFPVHSSTIKGPKQSELELRFLLQVMSDAHCYEWALIIAVMLQDTTSSTAALQCVFQDQDLSVDNKRHVVTGFEQLMAWAQTESHGYMWIMDSLREQYQSLTELLEEIQRTPTDRDAPSDSEVAMCSPLAELEHTVVSSTPSSVPVTPGIQEPVFTATDGPDDSQGSCSIS
ncbi:guanine nucleotide exchange factor subunit RIC1-like isoform X1 [Corticium candelabrum]|uniref:guanine nucleotide exchange factor subunit RIC1-like isoform X1 n=1 Tax=Corticium candelabrum TaxID=121492 RepID=UPI002E25A26E|nr:guanine nucleotide exchange factor subunit RIC1-like isoform X1 [Corticium candelabrum]